MTATAIAEASEQGELIVERASAGARLYTARGVGMRVVSIGSNLALIALVTPADLGLLAVIRGLTALAGNTTDLGFGWALLRRPKDPSRAEYAALTGIQLGMVAILLLLVAAQPTLLTSVAAVPAEWRGWTIGLLATTMLVPFGTSAKIRIERQLDYRRLAFLDVSSVLLLNGGLLGFALAHQFAIGVFVATGLAIVYANLMVWFWSPGPGPSLRGAGWRSLAREFAGFSFGHVCYVLYSSATPIVVANLFGLVGAGVWSFASRIGNVLQMAFEGFRRAAVPAAARLTADRESLRNLVEASLRGAAQLTVPLVALTVALLPVVGQIWTKWEPAVLPAQLYALGFGVAGMISAALVPAAVALRGAGAVWGEQIAPMAVGWLILWLGAGAGNRAIAWAVIPMHLALVATLWLLTDRSVRPRWTGGAIRPAFCLTAALLITEGGRLVGGAPVPVALVAVAAAGAIWASNPRILTAARAALRSPRGQWS